MIMTVKAMTASYLGGSLLGTLAAQATHTTDWLGMAAFVASVTGLLTAIVASIINLHRAFHPSGRRRSRTKDTS